MMNIILKYVVNNLHTFLSNYVVIEALIFMYIKIMKQKQNNRHFYTFIIFKRHHKNKENMINWCWK